MFTPATKAPMGEHDVNITFAEMKALVGPDLSEQLRQRSLDIFARGARHALQHGIIIADTKFEFGVLPEAPSIDGAVAPENLLLIDEVMTPDSSRFWPADGYAPGRGQPSYDKQFVRDWLSGSGCDKNSPPPELPEDVVLQTRAKYVEAYERITGETFAWA
jgi:phosphoribosylaminoimidazole-succinocarboxamide synthase